MKIGICLVGRFHATDISNSVEKDIEIIYLSNLPKFYVKKFTNIKKIYGGIFSALIHKFKNYFPFFISSLLNFLISKYISYRSIKLFKDIKFCILWSSCAKEFLVHKIKYKKPHIVYLERGNTHYSHQCDVLNNLYLKHNLKFKIDKYAWQRELYEYDNADFITVPTQFVKKTFIDNGVNEKKLFVNPYGVNADNFFPIKKEKKNDNFKIIFCGNASIRKGFHLLIELSNQKINNFIIDHVGTISNDFRNNYHNSSINYLGKVSQDRLKYILADYDALILPSFEEGLALVQLQSLSCGIPIISSEQAGFKEIQSKISCYIGEEIKDLNVAGLNKAIQNFRINEIDSYESKKKLYMSVKNSFSWQIYVNKYINHMKLNS